LKGGERIDVRQAGAGKKKAKGAQNTKELLLGLEGGERWGDGEFVAGTGFAQPWPQHQTPISQKREIKKGKKKKSKLPPSAGGTGGGGGEKRVRV